MNTAIGLYIICGVFTFFSFTYFDDARINSVAQRTLISILPVVNFLTTIGVIAVLLFMGIVAFWKWLGEIG